MPAVFNRHHRDAPSDAVYIGRGSPWGNPFVIGRDGDRNQVCDLFEAKSESDPAFKARAIASLKGRSLVCYCKPARCHGDYLLRIANPDLSVAQAEGPKTQAAQSGTSQAGLFSQ